MDIKEFLLARIAEDEAVARAAVKDWQSYGPADSIDQSVAQRLLAECAAKRSMIGFAEAAGMTDATLEQMDYGWENSELRMLHALAAVYAFHPEYQGEWGASDEATHRNIPLSRFSA